MFGRVLNVVIPVVFVAAIVAFFVLTFVYMNMRTEYSEVLNTDGVDVLVGGLALSFIGLLVSAVGLFYRFRLVVHEVDLIVLSADEREEAADI